MGFGRSVLRAAFFTPPPLFVLLTGHGRLPFWGRPFLLAGVGSVRVRYNQFAYQRIILEKSPTRRRHHRWRVFSVPNSCTGPAHRKIVFSAKPNREKSVASGALSR